MDSLISFDGISDVANSFLDKLSTAASWVATRETPNKVAINTYIEEIQSSNYDPLTKAALISNAKKIIKEYSNQVQIVQKAITLLPKESNPKDLDEDWLNEFMDKARLVSDEEFQIIWAKILAGEIERKNSFSIRTLNRVKSISKKEAETFTKIAKLAIGNSEHKYILEDKAINEKYGIRLDDIIALEECGFMSAQALTLTTTIVGSKEIIYEDNGIYIGMLKSKDGRENKVNRYIYSFTQSGKELLSVIAVNRNDDYLLDALKLLKQQNIKNDNLVISAHKILNRDGETIRYEVKDLLVEDDN